MIRFANRFVSLILFFISAATAHEQLILVVAKTMASPIASLQRYEYTKGSWHKRGQTIKVTIGRNGLGWGIGMQEIPHENSDPIKHEGDGKAPAGVFALGPEFGYSRHPLGKMPYDHATGDLICVDDADSDFYNQIVQISSTVSIRSFEWMHRDDGLYRHGIVVSHNAEAVPERGSCIFLHIQRTADTGTAGCTSMKENDLTDILKWLDPKASPLLIQIPEKSFSYIKKKYSIPQ